MGWVSEEPQDNPKPSCPCRAWDPGLPLARRHRLWASGLLEVRQISQQHRGIHLDLTLQRLNVGRVHAVALEPVSQQGG